MGTYTHIEKKTFSKNELFNRDVCIALYPFPLRVDRYRRRDWLWRRHDVDGSLGGGKEPTSRRTPSRRSLGWNRNKFRAPPRKEASRRLDINNFIDDYIKVYSSDCTSLYIIHPCFVVQKERKKERKERLPMRRGDEFRQDLLF